MALKLLEAVGIEIEYMIVSADTLNILPIADRILATLSSRNGASEAPIGKGITVSNELAMHVIELKVDKPVSKPTDALVNFSDAARILSGHLGVFGGRLMPGGMHPWMDPAKETVLWPHEYGDVYAAFDSVFGCKSHGWSNLQSMHINLPFCGDNEFARLHTAIRLMLPLIPAMAASTPCADGKPTGFMDTRLVHYTDNCKRFPCITGSVIPEPVLSEQEYHDVILDPIDAALVGYPLRSEWSNARGAIARFDRGSIEIRLADTQECLEADLQLADAICDIVRGLVEEQWCGFREQVEIDTALLAAVLRDTIKSGGRAVLPRWYTLLFGFGSCDAQSICRNLGWESQTLAERIMSESGKRGLRSIYTALCNCLSKGKRFTR